MGSRHTDTAAVTSTNSDSLRGCLKRWDPGQAAQHTGHRDVNPCSRGFTQPLVLAPGSVPLSSAEAVRGKHVAAGAGGSRATRFLGPLACRRCREALTGGIAPPCYSTAWRRPGQHAPCQQQPQGRRPLCDACEILSYRSREAPFFRGLDALADDRRAGAGPAAHGLTGPVPQGVMRPLPGSASSPSTEVMASPGRQVMAASSKNIRSGST